MKEASEEDIEDAKVEALNVLFKNIDMEMTEAEKASYVQLNLARHYINFALSILGLLVYSVLIHGVRTENPRSVNIIIRAVNEHSRSQEDTQCPC